MPTRAETTAATRRALLESASELLDAGGPAAVTLRAVGTRAGVSYQAPYRHFADKDDLLAALAAQAWDQLAEGLRPLRPSPADSLEDQDLRAVPMLRTALHLIISTSRSRPHLYRLMYTPADPSSPVAQAAGRAQDAYLDLVTAVVGAQAAWRYGGLVLSSVHGLIGFELSGFIIGEEWPEEDELIDLLIAVLPRATNKA